MNARNDVLDFPGAEELTAAGEVAPPEGEVIEAALTAVRQAAVAEEKQPRQRRFGRRRLVATAAAVAAVAATAVAIPVISLDGGEPAGSAAAADFLNSVADKAAAQQAGPGPYWKFTSKELNTDGTYRTETRVISPTGIGDKPAPNGKELLWTVGKKELNWAALKQLPTTPDALRRELSAGKSGDAANRQVIGQGSHLMEFSPIDPKVRAALYRVLARTPGLDMIGKTHDSEGRPGVEVAWKQRPFEGPGPHNDMHWIINQQTGQLLETRHIAAQNYDGSDCKPSKGVDPECSPSARKGDITGSSTYLFNGPVTTPR
ncbi:hypothetical protein G5C51_27355 [Streptomyces sp. A7024]|uniref:Uncharacterized protein n=1 Tax=Streptomyces coryli TaxID=1128680 RepID=A0A6G4U893_9ACTN|nr:CU044_5270 family protein [Streptomyces coryli]NGN67608.1 hypothetical protein [Streptomyces coryli]